ncbi:hypothetical protein GGX14DRAFT_394358 [Mycena pura]|uniref:Uncharacterized protein n=1 Tax=Mycena pura TaxID=153505 RepID=A0AAD6VEY1_9AGAR|nr:hypothetical protein GGX14DRAFT_394358 [Mycena pura]
MPPFRQSHRHQVARGAPARQTNLDEFFARTITPDDNAECPRRGLESSHNGGRQTVLYEFFSSSWPNDLDYEVDFLASQEMDEGAFKDALENFGYRLGPLSLEYIRANKHLLSFACAEGGRIMHGTHARAALPTAGNERAFHIFQVAIAADRQETVEAAALWALQRVEDLPVPPRLRLLDKLTAYMEAVDATNEATEIYHAMADPSNLAHAQSEDISLPPSSDVLTSSTVSEATQKVGNLNREWIDRWLEAVN